MRAVRALALATLLLLAATAVLVALRPAAERSPAVASGEGTKVGPSEPGPGPSVVGPRERPSEPNPLVIGVKRPPPGAIPPMSVLSERFPQTTMGIESKRVHLALDLPLNTYPFHVLFGDLSAGRYYHMAADGGRLSWCRVAGGDVELLSEQDLGEAARGDEDGPAVVLFCWRGILRAHLRGRPVAESPAMDGKLACAVYTPAGHVPMSRQKLFDLNVSDGFMREEIGRNDMWKAVSGSWRTRVTAEDRDATPNPFVLVGESRSGRGEEALLTAGEPYWCDYRMEASFLRDSAEEAALSFAWRRPGCDYRLCVTGGEAGERIRLERREGGRATVLAEKPVWCPPSRWFRLGVVVGEDSSIEGLLDGCALIRHRSGELLAGPVGIGVTGGRATFDDFRVAGIGLEAGPMQPVVRISQVYSQKPRYPKDNRDDHLQRWAGAADIWERTVANIGGLGMDGILNRTALFGDFRVEYPQEQPGHLTLCAIGNEVLHSFPCPGETGGGPFAIERRGDSLLCRGRPAAALSSGTAVKVGFFRADPLPADFPRPEVLSRNVWHEFFEAAPADWYPLSGEWKLSARWSCDAKWNWYQGVGPDEVVNFSKWRFEGGQVHEFYYGMKDIFRRELMLSPAEKGRRYARHDVNFSFCTDGKNLNSGYTVLFGGFDNKSAYLLRRDAIVAVNEAGRFPPFKDIWDLHLFWRRFRVEKIGGSVRVRLDDEVLFDWLDKEPLEGGHVALWTWKNGIVYALLRSSAERRVGDGGIYIDPRPRDGGARWQPLEPDRVLCRRMEDGRVRATNLFGGGAFAVRWAMEKPVDLENTPVMRIPFRPGPGVKVNLHVKVGGMGFVACVTAPAEDTYDVLGSKRTFATDWGAYVAKPLDAPELAPGCFYDPVKSEIRIDLLAEARRRFQAQRTFMLESLIVGNASNKDYLLAGFGGNGSGSTYSLGEPEFLEARLDEGRK